MDRKIDGYRNKDKYNKKDIELFRQIKDIQINRKID